MSISLMPNNKKIEDFICTGTTWFKIIKAMGYLFACIVKEDVTYYCNFSLDERMGDPTHGPELLSNDGFEVTDLECKMMARIMKNYVTLEEKNIRAYEWEIFKAFIEFAEKAEGFTIC